MSTLRELGIERWYPLARGTGHVVKVLPVGLCKDVGERAARLEGAQVLALVDLGRRRGAPGPMTGLLRQAGPGLTIERMFLLPGTGGSATIVPRDPRPQFEGGMSLFPAGRKRSRLAQRVLSGPGGRTLAERFGWGELALIRKANARLSDQALAPENHGFALSEGVPGPHRKTTMLVMKPDGSPHQFVKIAATPHAAIRIREEIEALRGLAALREGCTTLGPKLLASAASAETPWFAQEPLTGGRGPALLEAAHVAFVAGLAQRGSGRRPLGQLRASAPSCAARHAEPDPRDQPLADVLGELERALGPAPLPWTPCHGDFTPWNTRLEGGVLLAFDWELAQPSAPALFDLFHHLLQVGVLVQRADPADLLEEALELGRACVGGPAAPHAYEHEVERLLAAYVLIASARDLAAHRIERPTFPPGGMARPGTTDLGCAPRTPAPGASQLEEGGRVIEGILVALGIATLCWWISGARSLAYLLYFIGFVPFVTLDASDGGLTGVGGLGGGNVLFKLGVRGFCTAGFLILLARRRESLAWIFRPVHLPIVILFVWGAIWVHRAQDPFVSFFRLTELFVYFLAGIALYLEAGRYHGPREVARWHTLALLPIPLITLYFTFTQPELAYHVDASGLKRLGHKFINSNSLGFAAAASILWATVELRSPREKRRSWLMERVIPWIVIGACGYVELLARSRTAMITLVFGMVVICWPGFTKSARLHRTFGIGVIVLAFLVVGNMDVIEGWFLRGDSLEGLKSGTGRTDLWAQLWKEQVPKAPLGGAGYLMLSDMGGFLHEGRYWNNAHNTYVFALVATGLPGLLCVLLIVLLPLRASYRMARLYPESERSSCVLLFVMQAVVAIASITGFGVSGYPNPAMHYHYCAFAFLLAPRLLGETVRAQPAAPRKLLPRLEAA